SGAAVRQCRPRQLRWKTLSVLLRCSDFFQAKYLIQPDRLLGALPVGFIDASAAECRKQVVDCFRQCSDRKQTEAHDKKPASRPCGQDDRAYSELADPGHSQSLPGCCVGKI